MLHGGAVKFYALSMPENPSTHRRLLYFIGHVLMKGGQCSRYGTHKYNTEKWPP